jgi:hypothetical protein
MQNFQGNVDLNDAYFGPARNPGMPPPPRGAKPPAQQKGRRRPRLNGYGEANHLVTGVSGNLGQRLVPQLSDYTVVGVDVTPPTHSPVDRFVPLDLGREESTRELLLLLREVQPVSVVHLAFVIDPQRSGVLDVDRMWRINVAGTARVMEAIAEANRNTATISGSLFFPAACRRMAPICPHPSLKTRHSALTRCLTRSTRKKAIWSCSSARLPARVRRFHSASPHFCGSHGRKLLNGSVPRNAQWEGAARRAHAPVGETPALHAALRPEVSRQQNPVRPRRRYGPADRVDTEAGTGSAAADHPERCRTRRSFDLRAVYRTGAREIAARPRTVGHAPRSAISCGIGTSRRFRRTRFPT